MTPEHLAALYDAFRYLPPFNEWKLPDSAEVKFRVSKSKDYGEFVAPNVISISDEKHLHTFTVILTLAHEMIHLAQHIGGTDNKSQHNADFKKRAKRVCRIHGWDYKAF